MKGMETIGTKLIWITDGGTTPARVSVVRPNSTVNRMRAQFRPRPLARAIHSHTATGTRAVP